MQVCNARLSALIQLVLGELSPGDRTKIISLITLDVHARDVVRFDVKYVCMCSWSR
jgi:dynein heavy chain